MIFCSSGGANKFSTELLALPDADVPAVMWVQGLYPAVLFPIDEDMVVGFTQKSGKILKDFGKVCKPIMTK